MKCLKWVNAIAFLAMVGVNIAANMIPIGGNTTGEVSKAYPNLFTPAPITFAIWGVIYLFMLLFILFQCGFIGSKSASEAVRNKIGIFFAVSCGLNIAWIFAWHLRAISLSTLLIVLLLVSLIFITKRIDRTHRSVMTYIVTNVGFDIYLGWIIAATIANISVMLTKLNWSGWGLSDSTWTVIILIVGSLIASLVVFKDNRYMSGAAVIWAYIGILIKHLSESGYEGKYVTVIVVTALGIILILGTIVFRLVVPNTKNRAVSSLDDGM